MEEIKKTLEQYDLTEKEPITLVRESSDNEVFKIGDKERTVLRVSKRLAREDVAFEVEAMEHLGFSGVAVPSICKTRAGNYFSLLQGRPVTLFRFIDGRHVQVDKNNMPTLAEARSAGAELARMSNAGTNFITQSPRNRNLTTELERAFSSKNLFINEFEGGSKFIKEVESAIEFYKSQKEPLGLIHNDFRPGNVFFSNQGNEVVGVIDFDWCCIGPIIKDLALAVVEWSYPDGRDGPDMTLFESFLAGYNSEARMKIFADKRLFEWICFSTLSDACTYFCDLLDDKQSTKKAIKSYMYKKYLHFSNMI